MREKKIIKKKSTAKGKALKPVLIPCFLIFPPLPYPIDYQEMNTCTSLALVLLGM